MIQVSWLRVQFIVLEPRSGVQGVELRA